MWEVARPVLGKWVAETLAPEARVRETIDDAARVARRLPEFVENAADAIIGKDGIRLHPDSTRAIADHRSRRNLSVRLLLWAAVILLVILVIVQA